MKPNLPERVTSGSSTAALRIRLFIILLLITFALALAWLLCGTITQTVTLTGVSFPQNGMRKIIIPNEGTVEQVLVQVGDSVQGGDIIAVIPNEELYSRLQQAPDDANAFSIYVSDAIVRAPVDGKVSDVVEIGQMLHAGDSIATLVPDDQYSNQSEIRAYVPAAVAYQLSQGMEVQISPVYAPREQYGYLEGFISKVALFPLSASQIQNDLGGFENLLNISENESIVEIRATITADNDTKISIPDAGTQCDLQIITGQYHPIEAMWK